jgi:hypothetical protein
VIKLSGDRNEATWVICRSIKPGHLIQKKIRGSKQREEQELTCYLSTDWAKTTMKAKLKGDVGNAKGRYSSIE